MKWNDHLLLEAIAVLIVLNLVTPGFAQVAKREVTSFPGVIDQVSEEAKYIVVNETMFSLLPGTKVADEWGTPLRISDLRRGLRVTLGVVKQSSGYGVREIVVKQKKRTP